MKKKFSKQNTDYSLAHVLYQKLGNDWYAFTEVDGDCFMTKVDADTAEDAKNFDASREQENKHGRKRRAA
jgi:hypothetical protein